MIPEKILKWRRRKPSPKIMRSKTFHAIEKKARKAGADDPSAVAGAAYWRTVMARGGCPIHTPGCAWYPPSHHFLSKRKPRKKRR